MDTKLGKAMNAIRDAQQHLSSVLDYGHLECVYIDRMLAKVVDLPTDSKQKNTRRSLQMIRDWMITDGPGVVLLEVLGQLFWRLGDLNSKDFDLLKKSLHQQQSYLDLVQDPRSTALILQRVKYVQETKFNAFDLFIQELDNSPASSPPSRSTTPPRSRSLTRTRSISDSSLEFCNPLEATDITDDKITRTVRSLNAPTVPNVCTIGNWNLPNSSDLDHVLIEFYINCLCPRQTLITPSNTYLTLLPIALQSPSTLFALLSLSASYLKDTLLSPTDAYHQADHFYAVKAVQALASQLRDDHSSSTAACLATGMLLVHHDIVNETPETQVCWTCHINMLDMLPSVVDSDPAAYMRYQLTLARTAQPVERMQTVWQRSTQSTNRVLDDVEPERQRICGVLGLSRQLLSLIESITTLVAEGPFTRRDYKMSCAALLDHQLATLHQWTTGVAGKALEVVNRTAETYRIAAQIYLQCRFFGLTRTHPTVVKLNDELSQLILSLPDAGPLYTALYPTWPFFIAAVTCDIDMRDRLYGRVCDIRVREKSNLGSVLQHVSDLWGWIESARDVERGRQSWWEDMLGSVKERATLLSLG